MINYLTMLTAQSLEQKREIVRAQTHDNPVPEHALERTSNTWFGQSEYWFPEQASAFAPQVDSLYMAIFWICVVFFAAIVAVMIYFCIRYRRIGNEINPQPSSSHNTLIEIVWSVLPSLLLVYIFWEGASGFFNSRVAREDSEEIQVTASKWNWKFTYPNGDISGELHLVMDQPVKLVMRSDDVLHSMYVPAFRQKVDVVPGRYTYAYIMPTKLGEYRVACAEYCGDEHSNMRTVCEVHVNEELRDAKTLWDEGKYLPWKNGERVYKINCSGCHKIDSVAATGPALNAIWGTLENLTDGSTVTVDENYVLKSIMDPNTQIVEGYEPKMNSFEGKLTPEDVDNVIAFLKYLKEGGDPKAKGEREGAPADESGDEENEEAVEVDEGAEETNEADENETAEGEEAESDDG